MNESSVSLVAKGSLDGQVLRRLLGQANPRLTAKVCYGKRGREYLKQNIRRFSLAAAHQPFIVLPDLEQDECAPTVLRTWLHSVAHPNLVLRIAVRAIESWLLADQDTFAEFLGVSATRTNYPRVPDTELNPKQDGKLVVSIKGVDVYDPTTGQIRSNTTDEIACWFIDTDYDGESFFVRHAYFTGADEPYERLKRALRAEIDASAWTQLYTTTSLPFDPPQSGKLAVLASLTSATRC